MPPAQRNIIQGSRIYQEKSIVLWSSLGALDTVQQLCQGSNKLLKNAFYWVLGSVPGELWVRSSGGIVSICLKWTLGAVGALRVELFWNYPLQPWPGATAQTSLTFPLPSPAAFAGSSPSDFLPLCF